MVAPSSFRAFDLIALATAPGLGDGLLAFLNRGAVIRAMCDGASLASVCPRSACLSQVGQLLSPGASKVGPACP
eukprot:7950726-Pyramimonas_sp.AAC.1